MKVAIAPWGDPSPWKKSTYYLEEGGDSQGNRRKTESITSLKLLQEGVDKIYILVQDSALFTSKKEKEKGGINERAKECGNEVRAYNDLKDHEVIWPRTKFKDYPDLVERTKMYVECIARREGIGNAEAIVLPSNIAARFDGVPGLAYTEFKSDAKNYFIYSVGLLGLYEKLKGEVEKIEEVVVDTTHGINYFSTLSSNLGRDFASLVNVLGKGQVKVRYYSSVPMSSKEYTLTEVNKEVSPKLRAIDPQNLSGRGNSHVYYSLVYNSPLALIYSLEEYQDYKVGLDSVYSSVSLEGEGGLKVDYRLRDQVLNKADTTYLNILAKGLKEKLCKEKCGDWVEFNLLSTLSEEVYKSVSEASVQLIQHELYVLKKSVEKYCKDNNDITEVPYHKLYISDQEKAGDEGETGGKANGNIKRNAIAHAGLLKEFVKVKTEEGCKKILLSYDDWKKLKSAVYSR
ncbi:CRISPR-associated DxTHG motif protein [Metallosphaera tengchongensis]|uniref:CRISPR-associated DxTHG motif protein n=1 Tax=Metallosphaera tengchongensis TaxID=1532350 RepID=A0A6N0NX22_9CREN|nr:TM1812 family CRISPR-associated protein [Metallosphaera tengchongensis]QKR00767.1 CRISPR-associated DxTHG motif protein [Metallosphaera tengchongensis]